jgi:hypothetical protein
LTPLAALSEYIDREVSGCLQATHLAAFDILTAAETDAKVSTDTNVCVLYGAQQNF